MESIHFVGWLVTSWSILLQNHSTSWLVSSESVFKYRIYGVPYTKSIHQCFTYIYSHVHSNYHILWNLTILWMFLKVLHDFTLLAAFHKLSLQMLFCTLHSLENFNSVASSLQWLFHCRTSLALNSACLLNWFSAVIQLVYWTLYQQFTLVFQISRGFSGPQMKVIFNQAV